MSSPSKLTVQIELKTLGISPWENIHQRATSDDLSCSVNLCVSATVMLIMCYSFRLVLFLSWTGKDQHASFIRSSGDPTTRSSYKGTGMLFVSVNPN